MRQLFADELDVGNEPHVEHPIGFVDDEEFAPCEQDLAPLEQVHQPARGGDQHVNAVIERFDLVAHLHAADQQSHLEIVVLAVLFEVLGDLNREFAGGLKDQGTRHSRAAAAGGEDIDHRQHETGRLAGARLSNRDHVLHHQDLRDRLRLDGCRLAIASSLDCLQQFVGKAEIGKIHIDGNVRIGRGVPRCIERTGQNPPQSPAPMRLAPKKSTFRAISLVLRPTG